MALAGWIGSDSARSDRRLYNSQCDVGVYQVCQFDQFKWHPGRLFFHRDGRSICVTLWSEAHTKRDGPFLDIDTTYDVA